MENPLTDEKIAQLLDFVRSGVERTSDFVGEQAPLVCREIVAWTFWSSAAWIAVGLVFLLVSVQQSRKCFRLLGPVAREESTETVLPCVVAGIIAAGCILPGAHMTMSNIDPLIKSATAPRLVVIDYVKDLARPARSIQ